MTQVQSAIVSGDSVTLVIDGQTTPITDSHPNYGEIRRLAGSGTYAGIPALLNIAAAIEDAGEGSITVVDGEVLYKGEPTHGVVVDRILALLDEGLTAKPMIAFLGRLKLNPSFRAVQELYGFMAANDLPPTEDGYVTAYKMVRRKDDGTFTDIRTGTFDYSVGAKPAEMPRNEVNEDPNQTCSAGLHVCAQGYLSSGYSSGDCTILVKVDPADVVAVPTDYHNAKMRVCKHETICEVRPKTRGSVFTSAVFTDADRVRIEKSNDADEANLAGDENVITHEEALVHFDCNKGALRKRLNRGATAKRVYVSGQEMVQIIEADAPVADNTVSFDEAMHILGIDRGALRKRLDRGMTAKRVGVRVLIYPTE